MGWTTIQARIAWNRDVVTIVGESGREVCQVQYMEGDDFAEKNGYVNLILMAPELLELAKLLVYMTVNAVDPGEFTEIRNRAWSAIAAAEEDT